MEINFIPIDYDYFDWQERNYARIIGRLENGKKACIVDSFEPYFWAILKPKIKENKIKQIQEKIRKIEINDKARKIKVLKTELHDKNFLGNPVKAIKIFITNYKDAHAIADKIGMKEVDKRRGYDLGYITQYIIEKKLKPLAWYKIKGETLDNDELGGINSIDADICLKVNSIEELPKQEFKPKILAYDIEADEFEIGKGEIVMISLVGETFKKVLTWKHCSNQNFVECFKDEAEMLEAFVKYVKQQDPDVLVGYFSDGFDLPYLRARAEKNNIRLNLGIDNSQPTFSRGRLLTGKIKGIIHIDLLRFIQNAYSQYLQSETLSLNEVSNELLGERKNEWTHKHSSNIKKHEWEDYFDYNLQDSALTYKLTEKLWPDLMEITKIVGEPLFNISRSTMAGDFEDLIIHNLERFNEIPEKRPMHNEIGKRMEREKYEGAFVFQPIPGLYENIAFFDFTSMYASVIVSYNLSLSTLTKDKKNSYQGELGSKKVYFSKSPGFFPVLLKEIINKRKQYKEEYKKNPNPITKVRSNAYKLIANAAYGYQGFFGARYYCLEAAASTAYFARENIMQVIEKINKESYKVVYSDSVGGKTKVIIKENKKFYEIEIEKLFEKTDKKSDSGKEYNFKNKIEILTLDEKGNSIFKPINYVMRHKSNKEMYRIWFTNNWYIDVTEDHSLMGYQSNHFNQSKENKQNPLKRIIELKPEEIKKKANTIISLKKIPIIEIKENTLPKEFFEFMGYFIGDGSFMRNKSNQRYNKDYYLRLSLGSDKEEVFKKLIEPLKKLRYIKSHWWSNTRQGDITLNGLKLVKLISENCRSPEGKKIIPKWLFYEKEENINAFLRGLFSADGCVMIRNNAPIIKVTTIYQTYAEEIRKLLYRAGISHAIFKENSVNKYKSKDKTYSSGSQSMNIILKNKEVFAEKIGFLLERKNKLANIKTKNLQKKSIINFEFDLQSVKNIEEIKTQDYVYDIEVDDNHRFFANYVLVHNTDSVAFKLNNHTKTETLELLKNINKELPGIMELDLEDFYKRGIWVTKRTGEFGAKKKYALINEEDKIKIRGFETVRRDWCALARETQNKVLQFILHEGNEKKALEYAKQIIKQIKNREIPLQELIIRTQLKKPLEEYKSITPHVVAARKIKESGKPIDIGMLIEYFISETREKKSLVREKVKLPDEKGEYNIKYYLEHQILPAIENIFEVFNVNIKEIVDGKKQMNLGEF